MIRFRVAQDPWYEDPRFGSELKRVMGQTVAEDLRAQVQASDPNGTVAVSVGPAGAEIRVETVHDLVTAVTALSDEPDVPRDLEVVTNDSMLEVHRRLPEIIETVAHRLGGGGRGYAPPSLLL